MKITKKELCLNCFHGKEDNARISIALNYIEKWIEKNNFKSLNEKELKVLEEKIVLLKKYYKRKIEIDRNWERFEKNHNVFLQQYFDFDFTPLASSQIASESVSQSDDSLSTHQTINKRKSGRPKKLFSQKGRTAKWAAVKKLTDSVDEVNSEIFLEAALVASQREHNIQRTHFIKQLLGRKKKYQERKPKMATPAEAFEFFLSNNLSQRQFKSFQKFANAHNAKICPSYETILKCKKECYPANINVSDYHAYVPLQDLFAHTSARFILIICVTKFAIFWFLIILIMMC
ncbi:hypothetical protein PVAND_012141 [Polypedilum vanderplanki]|uniref:Uncharacterized protein n=1 Tax=Polypedilum vanderplanki TaxID=319348 RepID=A0A9J6CLV7_POLVA|nr:hypothetical protein PVAND_012141 [Polypedilum vanderplanki]